MCVICSDKDWEDLRKMPEHPTLVKEFKKSRLVGSRHNNLMRGNILSRDAPIIGIGR